MDGISPPNVLIQEAVSLNILSPSYTFLVLLHNITTLTMKGGAMLDDDDDLEDELYVDGWAG